MRMICSTIALYWSLLMLWIWTATEACVKHLKHKYTSAAQHLCSARNHPLNGIYSVSFASIKSKPWLMPVRPCQAQNDMQAQLRKHRLLSGACLSSGRSTKTIPQKCIKTSRATVRSPPPDKNTISRCCMRPTQLHYRKELCPFRLEMHVAAMQDLH
jgi:hypothetical protein